MLVGEGLHSIVNSILPPDVRGWRVGGQERLVVAGLEAREVVPGARAGARRGPR